MIVVIPTDKRIEITTINIKLLLAQGFTVVIVVSDREELRYYSNFDVHIVMSPNIPLGRKWNDGLKNALRFNPEHVVILGSDDLLSKDFHKKYSKVKVFTGFNSFYAYSDKLYHFRYLPEQGIGGGRIYPREYLDACNWQIFDTTKNKLLDDKGWAAVSNWPHKIVDETEILAIKGRWPVLNPLDPKHKNVKILGVYEGEQAKQIMKEKFNYG